MAEHDMLWTDPEQSVKTPGMWWVKWVTAALILLSLALISHTKGSFAHEVMRNARKWITTTTKISALKGWPAISHPAQGAGGRTLQGWLAPVASAHLKEGYGWHGNGANATFVPDVVLGVHPHMPVMSGVSGQVKALGHGSIELTAHGDIIKFSSLEDIQIHKGARVTPTTIVGRTQSRTLTLQVVSHGFPVNPLSTHLYGRGWLPH